MAASVSATSGACRMKNMIERMRLTMEVPTLSSLCSSTTSAISILSAIFAKDLEAIKAKFEVSDAYIQVEQMVVYIKAEDNFAVLKLMKEELGYTQLSEMSAIDWIAKQGQFEIFYQMLSMGKRKRIRVKCFIDQNQAIESVNPLFRSADWSEREMYDMFGVIVNNHPFMNFSTWV